MGGKEDEAIDSCSIRTKVLFSRDYSYEWLGLFLRLVRIFVENTSLNNYFTSLDNNFASLNNYFMTIFLLIWLGFHNFVPMILQE